MTLGKESTEDLFTLAYESLRLAKDNYCLALYLHDPVPKGKCWPDALNHVELALECLGHLSARLTDYPCQET